MAKNATALTDQAAHTITRVESLSYELRISQVMSPETRTAAPNLTMAEMSELFKRRRISGMSIVEQGKLVGIVSMADLIRAFRQSDFDAPVANYMSHPVITVRASDQIIEALKAFSRNKVGRFPVVDDHGKLVGMITKGDITRGVLKTLEANYQAEEVIRYRASHLFEDIVSDRTSLILRYHIQAGDFANGGRASSYIKRALLRLGADPQIARRCGIAIYEAEMNLVIHTTGGGTMRIEIEPHGITMRTVDDGPGIADVKQARQAGYSTASPLAREMGFGAGMGLVNIEQCVDRVTLESVVGKGTILEMKILLPLADSFKEQAQEGVSG